MNTIFEQHNMIPTLANGAEANLSEAVSRAICNQAGVSWPSHLLDGGTVNALSLRLHVCEQLGVEIVSNDNKQVALIERYLAEKRVSNAEATSAWPEE